MIAQTQLQSQIITLQSTVIKILEEALYTGQIPDIKRLLNASEFAREGSVRALRDQYQRMLQATPAKRPIGPVRRISSTPTLRDHDLGYRSSNAVVLGSNAGPCTVDTPKICSGAGGRSMTPSMKGGYQHALRARW